VEKKGGFLKTPLDFWEFPVKLKTGDLFGGGNRVLLEYFNPRFLRGFCTKF
jgi:hypothetical protein